MIFRVTIQTSSNLYTIYLYISNFQAIITYKVLFDMQLRHRSHNFSNIIQPIHNTSFKVILFDSLKKKRRVTREAEKAKEAAVIQFLEQMQARRLIVGIFYSRSRQMNVISAQWARGCYKHNTEFHLMGFSNKNLAAISQPRSISFRHRIHWKPTGICIPVE